MSIRLLLKTREQEKQQCRTEEQVYCHPAFFIVKYEKKKICQLLSLIQNAMPIQTGHVIRGVSDTAGKTRKEAQW